MQRYWLSRSPTDQGLVKIVTESGGLIKNSRLRIKTMVTLLKSGADKRSIQDVLKKLVEHPAKKGMDAFKHCGSVAFKKDGLALQKQWRDEWE